MSVPSPPDLFDDDADDAALSSSADGIKRTWTVLLDGTSSYAWKDKYVQHAAAQGGNADELKALLTRGSNATVDDVDDDQWTCLCYAAWENHQECVRILLECNADPLKANPNGAVPLMLACGTGE